MSDDVYNCGFCGSQYPNRDAYVDHLIDWHPESWLGKRSLKERELRAKKAARQAANETKHSA